MAIFDWMLAKIGIKTGVDPHVRTVRLIKGQELFINLLKGTAALI